MGKFGANLRASANIIPKGSHVVIVALIILLAICLLTGFLFLWFKPEHYSYSIPPFVFSVVFIILIAWFWFVSYKNIDSHLSSPTSITLRDDDTYLALTTDASSIRTPEGIEALERCLSMARQRRPLPEPDGLVDEKGRPIPESNQEAIERIRALNNIVHEMSEMIFKHSEKTTKDEGVVQRRSEHEPIPEEMIKLNKLE